MIEQVVACAKGKAPPPPELEIIWGCQRYGCLPETGGYLDQDDRIMKVGTYYNKVYWLVKNWRSKDKPDLADLSETDRNLWLWLVKDLEVKF